MLTEMIGITVMLENNGDNFISIPMIVSFLVNNLKEIKATILFIVFPTILVGTIVKTIVATITFEVITFMQISS